MSFGKGKVDTLFMILVGDRRYGKNAIVFFFPFKKSIDINKWNDNVSSIAAKKSFLTW